MIGVALLALLAGSPAAAQDQGVVGLAIVDCESAPIDPAALAERVALELGLPATEVSATDAPARTRVRVEAPCGSTRVVLTAHVNGQEVGRNEAEMADSAGIARVWALALLAAELVRSTGHRWQAVEPVPVAPPDPEPRPVRPTRPEVPALRTLLGAGLSGHVHLEVVTPVPGLALTLSRDWLRVVVRGFAMEMSGELGSISFYGVEAALGVRGILVEGSTRFGIGASVVGGVVHAAGHSTDAERSGVSLTSELGGGSLSLWMDWRMARTGVIDVEVSGGYDLAGPTFAAGAEEIASLHGLRAGLTLSLALVL